MMMMMCVCQSVVCWCWWCSSASVWCEWTSVHVTVRQHKQWTLSHRQLCTGPCWYVFTTSS